MSITKQNRHLRAAYPPMALVDLLSREHEDIVRQFDTALAGPCYPGDGRHLDFTQTSKVVELRNMQGRTGLAPVYENSIEYKKPSAPEHDPKKTDWTLPENFNPTTKEPYLLFDNGRPYIPNSMTPVCGQGNF